MLSYILRSKPSALAVYRALPGNLDHTAEAAGIKREAARNIIKLLVAAKLVYCYDYNGSHEPLFDRGDKPNAVRPTPEMNRTLREQRPQIKAHIAAYDKEYRLKNKQMLKDKRTAARDHIREVNAARRLALRTLAAQPPEIKTHWITT